MADFTVTDADLEALATKLDGMTEAFTDAERAALTAVFALAGAGLSSITGDVEGFGLGGRPGFEMSVAGSQGILIGLNQGFGVGGVGGLQDKDRIGVKLADGSVYKFGDGSVYKW